MTDHGDLLEAIRIGDLTRLSTLLDGDPALVASRPTDTWSPLLLSTYMRNEAAVDLLIRRGAVPDVHEAAALGRNDITRRILDADLDALQSHSGDGWTALHLAAHFGREETVRLLLKEGADVGARSRNENGNTPLHAAAAGGHIGTVKILLAAHADPNARDAAGHTPLHIAAGGGLKVAVKALLGAGADRTVKSVDGRTAADYAHERGHNDVVKLLH